ncbi:hypothetical protein N9B82_04155 [Saprospiraceae bacterium]|nr:hypothetical protein [Saprospiraceae bacterium]
MILSNSRNLLEDLTAAKNNGFTEEFIFLEGKIHGRKNKKLYSNKDCILVEYCIHEGMSDPSDQSILFLIHCNDETKGCLSSAYGIYADADLIEFCMSLEKQKAE